MSEPNITISVVEPSESGKVTYLPLAPETSNDEPKGRLLLLLKIKNNYTRRSVKLKDLRLTFAGPPYLLPPPWPLRTLTPSGFWADIEIGPEQTTTWWFQRPEDDLILPVPAPASITLGVSCHGFDEPKRVTLPLAAHKSPTPEGSYLFPARPEDLDRNEFWSAEGDVHGVGYKGSQSFGYDMGVVGYDDTLADWWHLHPGKSGELNSHFRIWNKPIHAMADGVVLAFQNEVPSNPNPLYWDTLEELEELLQEQQANVWGSFTGGGAGNHFYIQHGDEIILYAHLRRGTLAEHLLLNGATVRAGEFLGLAGNSGNSSAPHLHIHAIQGTTPEVGPMRPMPFRDAHVIRRSAFKPPVAGGAWAPMDGHGVPAALSLVWPSSSPPIYPTNPGNWRAVVYILFGVTGDGGGLALTPGGKPVPIDPWGPLKRLSAEKRDVLLGLALTELADLADSAETRAEVGKAGLAAINNALGRMREQLEGGKTTR